MKIFVNIRIGDKLEVDTSLIQLLNFNHYKLLLTPVGNLEDKLKRQSTPPPFPYLGKFVFSAYELVMMFCFKSNFSPSNIFFI